MKSRLFTISIFTLFVLVNNSLFAESSFLTMEAISDGWEANYANINSMDVGYEYNVLEMIGKEHYDFSGFRVYEKVNLQESGQRYYLDQQYKVGGRDNPLIAMKQAFDGKSSFKFERMGTVSKAYIENGMRENNVNKVAKLLQCERPNKKGIPLFLSNMEAFIDVAKAGGNVRIRPDIEMVSGHKCHVIEVSGKDESGENRQILLWVAHDAGMLPMWSKMINDDQLILETKVEKVGSVMTDHGEIYYPLSAIRFVTFGDDHKATLRSRIEITKFVPHAKFDDSVFKIDIPDGTTVVDKTTGIVYTKGVGTIAIEVIEELSLDGTDTQEEITQSKFETDKQEEIKTSQSEIDTENLESEMKNEKSGIDKILVISSLFVVVVLFSFGFKVYRRKKHE